jgi:glucose-1-phosphate thymidylyltransferase
MREIWGLVPAAGKATRLARDADGHRRRGPSKEILPLPKSESASRSVSAAASDTPPRIACQDLLDSFRLAGISRALVLLRPGKWDIPQRLGDGSEFGVDLAYRVLPETRGVPFTLAAAAPFLGDRMAALGFPDLQLQPRDLLARLVRHREQNQSDLALALVPCTRPQSSDLVDLSPRGKVRRIEIKPEATTLKWTWAFAVWTPHFTRYLQKWTAAFHARSARLGREPHAADVFVGALAEGFEIDALTEPAGRILDIGTPETLAAAAGFHSSV